MRPDASSLPALSSASLTARLASPFLPTDGVDLLAGEQRHVRIVGAVLGDRVGHLHAVGDAQLVVVGAMARRDVHEAGAGVGGDEVARQQAHVEVVALAAQRMGGDQAVEIVGARRRPRTFGVNFAASATAPTRSLASTIFSPTRAPCCLRRPRRPRPARRRCPCRRRARGCPAWSRASSSRSRPTRRRACRPSISGPGSAHAPCRRCGRDTRSRPRPAPSSRPRSTAPPWSPCRARRSSGTCRARPRSPPRNSYFMVE